MYTLFLLGPALFVSVAFLLGFITPDYSLMHNTISELVLRQYHIWQTANFIVSGCLLIGLGILLWRAAIASLKAARFASACIALFGLVLVLSGIFKTDPVTSTELTATGLVHNLVFLVGMLGMVAAQVSVGVKNFRSWFGKYSVLSGIISFAALVGVVATHTVPGIPQRILVVLVMTWITLFALRVKGRR